MGNDGGSGGNDGGSGGGGRGLMGFGFFRGLFGPSRATHFCLEQVAAAHGLRDVDELMVSLGKRESDFRLNDALNFAEKELGPNMNFAQAYYLRAGKGYRPCNRLMDNYIKTKAAKNQLRADLMREDLMEYCSYTEDELNS